MNNPLHFDCIKHYEKETSQFVAIFNRRAFPLISQAKVGFFLSVSPVSLLCSVLVGLCPTSSPSVRRPCPTWPATPRRAPTAWCRCCPPRCSAARRSTTRWAPPPPSRAARAIFQKSCVLLRLPRIFLGPARRGRWLRFATFGQQSGVPAKFHTAVCQPKVLTRRMFLWSTCAILCETLRWCNPRPSVFRGGSNWNHLQRWQDFIMTGLRNIHTSLWKMENSGSRLIWILFN